jgi:GNAT superfamily N-acetyltransferase
MIRPTTPDDLSALIALADAIGLFQPEQLQELHDMLVDYFRNSNGNALPDSPAECFWLTDDDTESMGGPVGVAYCEPERMTDQTWNLQLIAIHPDRQGQGRGAALLHYVEETLVAWGGRLLLVETSGLPELERTRAFYSKCGYREEARIRDFYAAGDDKVVFCKVLSAD